MRKLECLQLRVKDLDLERRQIVIREGKGNKDRITALSSTLEGLLYRQLKYAQPLWTVDRQLGRPGVAPPLPVQHRYPRASENWGSFWAFLADHESVDPRSGVCRRHPLYEGTLGIAIKRAAVRAQINKPIGTHTLRHSFATHL